MDNTFCFTILFKEIIFDFFQNWYRVELGITSQFGFHIGVCSPIRTLIKCLFEALACFLPVLKPKCMGKCIYSIRATLFRLRATLKGFSSLLTKNQINLKKLQDYEKN